VLLKKKKKKEKEKRFLEHRKAPQPTPRRSYL
jgi:hypothetical protein